VTHPESPSEPRFLADVLRNRFNRAILASWNLLDLPDGWLVAGCLFQTVWNLQAGRAPEADIKDYDIFYFDPADLSARGEQAVQRRVDAKLGALGVPVEVKNQARVHLWYEQHFGFPYPRLSSASDGIDRFLIPATCVGVQRTPSGDRVYAPNGLSLLYAGELAPNPVTAHLPLFRDKAASYRRRWPWLRVSESC
jgi:uncharacterized protein